MISRLRATTGIYLITPQTDDSDGLCSLLETLLRQPVDILQYRHKGANRRLKRHQAEALLRICRPLGVPLVINDDWRMALEIGADGVHLGATDDDPTQVRAELGDGLLIGVSCYGDLERAKSLAGLDIDYLAFGAMFDSPTKPAAVRAPLSILREARALGKPSVAIGGITPDNGRQLRDAGADFIAVISGVFDAPDPAAALTAYHQAFNQVSA